MIHARSLQACAFVLGTRLKRQTDLPTKVLPVTCLRACRYTKDIPQHGSMSGTDGKPVIFPYIDLNIQTLQGNGQIRSSVAAAPGAYGQAATGSTGIPSNCSVTPGRPGMNGAVRMAGGMAADRDVMVTRLSAAFTRIASTNVMERVSVQCQC